ncbi:uncharacterized protein A4U43_C07F30690 [Asparagus officinalis]|uniref:Uncharacterized protein n=1 Tax=Asparagus officinalis TaxID=4686 RepID=A0A5P1EG26_ASPOF|nr:uncharacterized protein A4U43_C07F30690 [Asparagus officinalis]
MRAGHPSTVTGRPDVGKESVVEESVPPIGLEYLYPHRVAKIGEEEWEMMSLLTISMSGDGSWFSPDSVKGGRVVLASLGCGVLTEGSQCQSPPKPSELLGSRCFGGAEDIQPNDQTQTSYLNILGEIATVKADRGVDSERVAETLAQRAFEIDRLR